MFYANEGAIKMSFRPGNAAENAKTIMYTLWAQDNKLSPRGASTKTRNFLIPIILITDFFYSASKFKNNERKRIKRTTPCDLFKIFLNSLIIT